MVDKRDALTSPKKIPHGLIQPWGTSTNIFGLDVLLRFPTELMQSFR